MTIMSLFKTNTENKQQNPTKRLSLNYSNVYAILSDNRPTVLRLKGYFIIKCLEYGTNKILLHWNQVALENRGGVHIIRAKIGVLEKEGFLDRQPSQQGELYIIDRKYFENV